MRHDYQQLLEPKIINSISGLTLVAKVIVDGYMSGLNQSRRVGAGLEFSQYRGYEPGDDMRLLDWKMLARSGRYYIKQSEIDTHISVKFIIDTSKSMQHAEGMISKLDYVKVLTASLGYLAQHQGDAIGLFALNDTTLRAIQPSVQKQHYNRFINELIELKAEGKWPENTTALTKVHDRTRKELVFFITDMHENKTELTNLVKRLKTKQNEVAVLHIMGDKELNFDYEGFVTFEDLETGSKVKVDAKTAKKTYLKGLNKKLEQSKNELLSNAIGYQMFLLKEPISEALQLFLKRRNALL